MGLLDYLLKGSEIGMSLLANTRDASTASDAGKFNQQIELTNAERAKKDAAYIRRRTELEVNSIRRNAKLTEGTQRAAFGASGVSVSSGSSIDVLKDTAHQAALDVEIIRMEGAHNEHAAMQSAKDYEKQSEIERWKGDRTSTGFKLGAGASLLKGGADLYDMWKKRG